MKTITNPVSAWKPALALFIMGVIVSSGANASGSIEQAGTALQILIPGIAYGATFYKKDAQGRSQFYKSFATNLLVTQGLKATVHENRPNGGQHSFPSGHTSAAFQGAAFIHKRYGLKMAIPAYLGAAFVGYSRVQSDNHYTKDVVAGALIGIASSFYFSTPYKGLTLSPAVDNGHYWLTVSKSW